MTNTNDNKAKKYRLAHYNYKGWSIDEYAERTNPRTKEAKWEWKTIKYPGALEVAAKGLLDCYIDQKEYDEVAELIKTVDFCTLSIIEALKEIVVTNQE